MKLNIRRTIKATESLLCVAFVFAIAGTFSGKRLTALTLLAIILHEAAHIFAVFFLRKRLIFPGAKLFALRILLPGSLSYKDEIICALSGPFFNLILFIFILPFFEDFALLNLMLALTNLVPICDSDGQRALRCALSLSLGIEKSEKITETLSLLFTASLVFLSLFFILNFNGAYPIFFVFFAFFLREIYFFHKETKNEDK